MVLMTTTYRHDFVPPKTNRYRFATQDGAKGLPTNKSKPDCEKLCHCGEKYPLGGSASLPMSAQTNLKSEWTGIAPMGLLVDPRIIPNPPSGDLASGGQGRDKATACMEDQPNRFLKILRTCYPDLYDRLNRMPQNELKRRLDIERLKTTYQIDYCRFSEYPDGLYESIDTPEKNEFSVQNAANKHIKCGDLDSPSSDAYKELVGKADECLKTYKPFKANFTDNPTPVNRTDDSAHWSVSLDFSKKPRVTEYMDTVSRTGCVIRKNKIHSHNRCHSGKNCLHKLKYPCKTFK